MTDSTPAYTFAGDFYVQSAGTYILGVPTVIAERYLSDFTDPGVSQVFTPETYTDYFTNPTVNNDTVDTAGLGYRFDIGDRWIGLAGTWICRENSV